ncbi:MAG: hypothetical protein GY751_08825 [Bacteroidetes bacterium]|nr:hypothetical protein [Bacteroidota bacterium]
MSDCKNKNPLALSGTAQENRMPKFLDPDRVQIDGKTEEDYRRIVQELAKLVQYYDGNHLREGGWEDFFEGSEFEKENPHIALFNAFIELIQYAQDDINDITAKHLEFYYKDVLQLALKSETADEAHIIFELANNISRRLVEEGTFLKAGKDANNKERRFVTKSDIVVNNSAVSELKSVFVEEDVDGNKLVYSSPVANSSDGIGGDLNEENPKWAPFGENQAALDDDKKSMELASIGFAIASQYLLLKEGDRKIILTLRFASTHGMNAGGISTSGLNFLFSGEEEWIEIKPTTLIVTETDVLEIVIDIPADEDAVVEYNEEIFQEQYNVAIPLMKVLINQEESPAIYNGFTSSTIESIQIDLDVDGVKDLVLQNETGTLNPSKPFEIFASRPVIGSEFFVGSKEIFGKTLTSLKFTFDWQDKPSLGSYYDRYSDSISASSFDVEIEGLRKRSWQAISNPAVLNLFDSDSNPISTINLSAIISDVFEELVEVASTNQLTTNLKNGFIRIQLVGPTSGLIAFGHSQYQNLYVTESIEMARNISHDANFPNEPYTPKVKSLSIDYQASHTLELNADQSEESLSGSVFHIGPFGINKKTPSSTPADQFTLIPDFTDEGSLYIGIEDMELPQNLSVLFQVAEGSADPSKMPSNVDWYYLENNNWEEFKDVQVLSDSTNGLINSGIINFDVPKTATNENTWLTTGLHWIKASLENDSDSVCQMVDVRLQAITAKFENNDNDLAHLEDALPAETISKLKESDSAIRKVEQPYASFNGKLPELEDNYYRRVAERLRHKNRAITIWDFERIVLEEYTSVYKLKCLNHTRMTLPYSEKKPGHVSLVVVSNLRNKNAIDPLKPTTSVATLESIKSFLEKIQNPFITLDVENPFFEEIKVEFNVKFHDEFDKGFYKGQLNKDIKKHLSPWAYTEGEDISFDGVIHKSRIIDFIEELEYVDYLTCFKMYQIIDGDETGLEDINEAKPTKSASLLVSASDHTIDTEKLLTDDCSCEDGNVTNQVITDGIGTMTVALDFIVNKP